MYQTLIKNTSSALIYIYFLTSIIYIYLSMTTSTFVWKKGKINFRQIENVSEERWGSEKKIV